MTDIEMDEQQLVDCLECGRTVTPIADHAYSITDEVVLCYDCAVRRGGVYDSDRDDWSVAPKLENLPADKVPAP